jgi:hypothetical protein
MKQILSIVILVSTLAGCVYAPAPGYGYYSPGYHYYYYP